MWLQDEAVDDSPTESVGEDGCGLRDGGLGGGGGGLVGFIDSSTEML